MANVDPVSDFLAREQDALADLNDDGDFAAAPVPVAPAAEDAAPTPAPPVVQNGLGSGLTNGGDSGVDLSALDRDISMASPMQNG